MCPHASSARDADAPWLMPGLCAPRYTGRQAAFALRRCEGCIGCIAGSGEAVARDKWPGCREGGCGALPCPSRRPQCRQQCRMVPAPISLAATRLPCCMPRRGYAARRAAQGGKLLPLHHAAKCGAPFEVVELLLEANREAAATLTQARAVVPTRPPPPHAVEALRAPPLTLLSRLARLLSPSSLASRAAGRVLCRYAAHCARALRRTANCRFTTQLRRTRRR